MSKKGNSITKKTFKKSNDIFQSIIEHSGEAILFTHPDGSILSANPEACNIFGGTEKEICEAGRTGIVDINDSRLKIGLEERQRTGKFKGELNMKRLDGTYFPAYVSTVIFKDETGEDFTSMIIRDLTQQKLTEKALKESEEKYRELVENSLLGVFKSNVNGKLLFANEALVKMLEYDSLEELSSIRIQDLYKYPEQRTKLLSILKSNGEIKSFEANFITKNGDERIFLGNLTLIGDEINGTLTDTTARNRAENIIKTRNILFNAIVNSLEDIILFSLDRNYCYTAFNEMHRTEMKKIWNVDIRIGMNLLDCMTIPKLRKLAKDSIDRTLQGEIITEIQYQSDKNIYYEFFWNPIKQANDIIGVVVFIQNITSRKLAEIELKDTLEKANRFSKALDYVSSYIYMKDLNGKYIYANRSTLEYFGCTLEELDGCDDSKFFPENIVNKLHEIDSKVFKGEQTSEEIDISNENGNRNVYMEVKTPIYSGPESKEIIGLLGISTDITERKKKEEDLRISEEKYKSYFELPYTGRCITSPDKGWLEVNTALCDMLGYSKDELLKTNWEDLTHPDDLTADLELFNKVVSCEIDRYELDKRFLHKDGHFVYTHLAVHCLRKPDKSIDYFVAIIIDISKQKLIEEELRKSETNLIKLNSEKDKFFSIIAHDLRNPFTGLLGYTDILTQDLHKLTIEDLQKIANNLKRNANNLYDLLTNLLEWASMQMGRIDYIAKDIKLKKVINSVIETNKFLFEKKDLSIEIIVPENLNVYADLNMTTTIFRNLINNAIKFSKRNGKIIISAYLDDSNENVISCVQDFGIGMSKKLQNNLFKLNEDVKRKGTENEPSSGLGLLLCKDFVDRSNGKIWVESEEGKGSKFYFTLSKANT